MKFFRFFRDPIFFLTCTTLSDFDELEHVWGARTRPRRPYVPLGVPGASRLARTPAACWSGCLGSTLLPHVSGKNLRNYKKCFSFKCHILLFCMSPTSPRAYGRPWRVPTRVHADCLLGSADCTAFMLVNGHLTDSFGIRSSQSIVRENVVHENIVCVR